MNKKEAIRNIKITGWLFVIIGIIALLSVVYYWGEKEIIDSIFDFLFGICMLYFSYLILSSAKFFSRQDS